MQKQIITPADFTDLELGEFRLYPHPKARRIIFRCPKKKTWHVTCPPTLTQKQLKDALQELRPRLLKQMELSPETNFIDETFTLQTPYLHLTLQRSQNKHFQIHRKELKESCRNFVLLIPQVTELKEEATQQLLRKAIILLLRERAKQVLPPLLKELALTHGFSYHKVNIHNAHSCWGSCSGKGTINLSLYLMLLPEKLVTYVLYHELCHTIEMNHSERFWKLLNTYTSGEAQSLRKQLRTYHTHF